MKISEFKKLLREEVRKALKEQQNTKLVTVQISDPIDDFGYAGDFGIPTSVKSLVGKPNESNSFIFKLEKALLSVGQQAVPGLEKYTIEDGGIIFKLPDSAGNAEKAKLKKVFSGAKEVEFDF
jgi:hypothetical protein